MSLIQKKVLWYLLRYIIALIYIRGFLGGVIRYQLNKNAYKKKKRGQSLKEWLLCSKFKDEIPNILLKFYYFVLALHTIGVAMCFWLYTVEGFYHIGLIALETIFWFDAIWVIGIVILFWQNKPGPAYKRWINKKRGQKKKK